MLKRHAIPVILLLVAAPLSAATLRVPLDHPDVPAALAAAADGDTVAVAASVIVSGGLVVPGRALSLLGGWNDDFSAIVGRTAIAGTPAAPAMRLEDPVSGSPLVAGFAITGGGGAERSAPTAGRYGGGVLVEGGDPILRDLHITSAAAGDPSVFGAGGGLALLGTDALVESITVSQCVAVRGGGIYVDGGAPVLRDCSLVDNTCRTSPVNEEARGSGLAINLADVIVENCGFRGGRGAARGGGIAWLGTRGRLLELRDCTVSDNEMDLDGAGLYAEAGAVTVTGGDFTANGPSPDAPYTSGGGVYLTGARVALDGVIFRGNVADAGAGATVNTAPQADVRHCVFIGNEATLFGAALNYQSNDAGEILGNTAAANDGAAAVGVVNLVNTSPLLARNIVAFNAGQGVAVSGGTVAPSCNDVYGNTGAAWSGIADPTGQDGNFAADPLFCDLVAGDVALDAASPCLDADGCGSVGALGAGCGSEVSVSDLPGAGPSVAAFPNPFNPAVTLRIDLVAPGPAHLTVHDLRGRLVRDLLHGAQPAGRIAIRWDGRDGDGRGLGSGVYVYRLITATGTATGRLTLVR